MTLGSPRRGALNQFPDAPLVYANEAEHRRLIAEGVNSLREGKIRSTGEVTFTADQTTTTIEDRRIGPMSVIQLMPTTESAAGEVGWWWSSQTEGSATITHASDSRTDRTFRYVILG